MTSGLHPANVEAIVTGEGVTFEGVEFYIDRAFLDNLWSAVAYRGSTVADNPAAGVGVLMASRTDDQGRTWYALFGEDWQRGLTVSALDARVLALRLTLPGSASNKVSA